MKVTNNNDLRIERLHGALTFQVVSSGLFLVSNFVSHPHEYNTDISSADKFML